MEGVKRMDAIKIYEDASRKLDRSEITLGEFEQMIAPLRSVEQLKHGHWEYDGSACYCSECKKSAHKDYNKWDVFSPGVWILSDFCPHCGADMRGEQDE